MKKSKVKIGLTYQDRIFGYERDKQRLLSTSSHLTAAEFSEMLKFIQKKWRI